MVSCHVAIFFIPTQHQTDVPNTQRKLYTDLKKYFSSLINAEIVRLFTNFTDWFMKIYCTDLEDIIALKTAILEDNKYSLEFSEIGKETINMGGSEKPVCAEVSREVLNVNGAPITLLTDAGENQYVSVTQAKQTGFNVFSSEDEARRYVITSLKEYLEDQAQLYLNVMHLNYRIPHDIMINVKFANNEVSQVSLEKTKTVMYRKPTQTNKKSAASLNITIVSKNLNVSSTSSSSSLNVSDENAVSPKTSDKNLNTFIMNGMTPRQLMSNLRRKNERAVSMHTSTPIASPPKKTEKCSLPKKCTKLEKYPNGSVYVDKMKSEMEVQLHVLKITSKTTFIGFVISEESIQFEDVLVNASLDNELLIPCVGEMVLIKQGEEKASRALILELLESTYKVAALELGEVVEVDSVFEMPKELHDFDEFVCCCEAPSALVETYTVDDGIATLTKGANLLMEIKTSTNIECKRWVPNIASLSAPLIEKKPIPPKPKLEQKMYTSLPTAVQPITTGDKLVLAGFGEGILHLRSWAMRQLITDMNKALQKSAVDALEKPPISGQYVLLKNGGDQTEWRRCLVKGVLDEGVFVQHIDYFNSQKTVPAAELYNLSPCCATFGPTLRQMRLRNFEDKEYSPNALQFIKESVKKKFEVVFLQDGVVDLQAENSPKCLSDMLLDLDLPEFYTIKDLPPVEIVLNEEFQMMMFHTNDDGTLYFMMSGECVTRLGDLMEELSEIEEFERAENVTEGQLCIAQSDGDWCRGVIQKIDANQTKVFFIDFANAEDVNLDDIRAFPERFLNVGACALKGIITDDSKFKGEFHRAYMAIVKKKVDNLHHIQLVQEIEE